MMFILRFVAKQRFSLTAYNYEEGGEMKEMETRHSLERRERCLRWKLSVPRVGPIAGPLTVVCKSHIFFTMCNLHM